MEFGVHEDFEGEVPVWFGDYVDRVKRSRIDLLGEVQNLSTMTTDELRNHLGGDIEDLPYEVLQTLFIDGSDDSRVVDILRSKREEYIDLNPDKRVAAGASEGIIGFDGRVVSAKRWATASD